MSLGREFQVSVIIPLYNAARYLERAVRSALAEPQVGEVILVEDCSPDHSWEVCQKIAALHPARVRLLRHPDGKNHGAGPSRNLGIRAAKYPFIAFLDADDYYLPHRFKRDEEILLAEPTIDGVYNALGIDIQDAAGKEWLQKSDLANVTLSTVHPPPPPDSLYLAMKRMGGGGTFHFNTVTLRRPVFDKVAYFSDLRLMQDTLLRHQLVLKCRLMGGVTERAVAMRGVHAENRIRDIAGLRRADREVLAALLAWAPTAQLSPKQYRTLYSVGLRGTEQWPKVRAILKRNPHLLLRPYAIKILLQRIFLRHFPNDPPLPGIFPRWRKGLKGKACDMLPL